MTLVGKPEIIFSRATTGLIRAAPDDWDITVNCRRGRHHLLTTQYLDEPIGSRRIAVPIREAVRPMHSAGQSPDPLGTSAGSRRSELDTACGS